MKTILLLSALALVSCKSEEDGAKENTNSPEIVTYSGPIEDEADKSSPEVKPTTEQTPSESLAKVIAANTTPAPVPADTGSGIPRPTPQPRVPTTPNEDKPSPPKYKVAEPIPGRPGYVFNPWTNGVVDVRGIPKGALIRDPKDSNRDHKFRVPE